MARTKATARKDTGGKAPRKPIPPGLSWPEFRAWHKKAYGSDSGASEMWQNYEHKKVSAPKKKVSPKKSAAKKKVSPKKAAAKKKASPKKSTARKSSPSRKTPAKNKKGSAKKVTVHEYIILFSAAKQGTTDKQKNDYATLYLDELLEEARDLTLDINRYEPKNGENDNFAYLVDVKGYDGSKKELDALLIDAVDAAATGFPSKIFSKPQIFSTKKDIDQVKKDVTREKVSPLKGKKKSAAKTSPKKTKAEREKELEEALSGGEESEKESPRRARSPVGRETVALVAVVVKEYNPKTKKFSKLKSKITSSEKGLIVEDITNTKVKDLRLDSLESDDDGNFFLQYSVANKISQVQILKHLAEELLREKRTFAATDRTLGISDMTVLDYKLHKSDVAGTTAAATSPHKAPAKPLPAKPSPKKPAGKPLPPKPKSLEGAKTYYVVFDIARNLPSGLKPIERNNEISREDVDVIIDNIGGIADNILGKNSVRDSEYNDIPHFYIAILFGRKKNSKSVEADIKEVSRAVDNAFVKGASIKAPGGRYVPIVNPELTNVSNASEYNIPESKIKLVYKPRERTREKSRTKSRTKSNRSRTSGQTFETPDGAKGFVLSYQILKKENGEKTFKKSGDLTRDEEDNLLIGAERELNTSDLPGEIYSITREGDKLKVRIIPDQYTNKESLIKYADAKLVDLQVKSTTAVIGIY